MGKLKRRIRPDEITINIGKGEPVPECPIPNERWKEVKHDNTVTWLAFWKNPIDPKAFKYVFLDDTSSWKGQSDKDKYEKARLLKVINRTPVASLQLVMFYLEVWSNTNCYVSSYMSVAGLHTRYKSKL